MAGFQNLEANILSASLKLFLTFFVLVCFSYLLSSPTYVVFVSLQSALILLLGYRYPKRFQFLAAAWLGWLSGYILIDPMEGVVREGTIASYASLAFLLSFANFMSGVTIRGVVHSSTLLKYKKTVLKLAAINVLWVIAVVGFGFIISVAIFDLQLVSLTHIYISIISLTFFNAVLWIPLLWLLLGIGRIVDDGMGTAQSSKTQWSIFVSVLAVMLLPFIISYMGVFPSNYLTVSMLFAFQISFVITSLTLSFNRVLWFMGLNYLLVGVATSNGLILGDIQNNYERLFLVQVVLLGMYISSYVTAQVVARLRGFLELNKQERIAVRRRRDAATQELEFKNDALETVIRENTALKDKLEYKAYTNDVSGLHNGYKLREELSGVIENSKIVHVITLNISNMGYVNVNFGHKCGEMIVEHVAGILTRVLKRDYRIYSWTNEQFVVLLPNQSKGVVDVYIEAIMQNSHKIIEIDKKKVLLELNAGIVPVTDFVSLDTLLSDLNLTLERAQHTGKKFVAFTPEMRQTQIEQELINSDMWDAVKLRRFKPFFQPIVDAQTFKICGVEALTRWKSQSGDVLRMPDQFIPIAERNGLIIDIGEQIIDQSLSFLKDVEERLGLGLEMSINVSTVQLQDDALVGVFQSKISEYGIEGSKVKLEITESLLMGNRPEVQERLKRLKENGAELSLDDFGTGFSSLSYVQNFPFDIIKIDKSFVDSVLVSKKSQGLINALMLLARDANLRVVAEGVESKEQAEYLARVGVNQLQGFFYSKPVSAEDLISILESSEDDLSLLN